MVTMSDSVAEMIEDEWYIVRHSGETPEIALHSALYYLMRSKDGPRISLTEEQLAFLQQAAVDRYYEIIVRDMQHANYGTAIYRGIDRSIINYQRFCTFCERQKIDRSVVQQRAAAVLKKFLEIEVAEAGNRDSGSIINCPYKVLKCFAVDLGVEFHEGYAALVGLCPSAE